MSASDTTDEPTTPEREERVTVGEGAGAREIAVRVLDATSAGVGSPGTGSSGAGPTLVWCGGYRSDMTGSKAQALVAFARSRGLASVRFDYSGHGISGGAFADGTISRWVEEALAVVDAHASGPLVVVGSSMGAWIALRLAQERPGRLAGLLLIAPAPDFTSDLLEPSLTDEQRAALARDGSFTEPSVYSDEPDLYTRALIEDGERNRVLNGPLAVGAPVRILQGMRDEDVPHAHALKLVEALAQDDVTLTLVRDGDHRLSRDEDLRRLETTLAELVND